MSQTSPSHVKRPRRQSDTRDGARLPPTGSTLNSPQRRLMDRIQHTVDKRNFYLPLSVPQESPAAEMWLRDIKIQFGFYLQRMILSSAKRLEVQRLIWHAKRASDQVDISGYNNMITQYEQHIKQANEWLANFEVQQANYCTQRGEVLRKWAIGTASPEWWKFCSTTVASRQNTAVQAASQRLQAHTANDSPFVSQTHVSEPFSTGHGHPVMETRPQYDKPRELFNQPVAILEPRAKADPPPNPEIFANTRPGNNNPASIPPHSLVAKGHVLEDSPDGHVVSRAKIQQLVNEAMPGDDNSAALMTPEVEEILLNSGDEFVDNLLRRSCKLAKLRGGTQLEVKDILVVLEREYNMRIPGFSSDELRVVKRPEPTIGWKKKVNAVNAAKSASATNADAAPALQLPRRNRKPRSKE